MQARRQDSMTGEAQTSFVEAQKLQSFEFESVDQKTKVLIANFHEFWGEDKKKKERKF